MMSPHKLFQGFQALLIAVLLLGGIWLISSDYPYGWAMVTIAGLLFLYDRRGLILVILANSAYRSGGLPPALVWFDCAWKWKSLDANAQVTYAFLLMKAARWEDAEKAFRLMKQDGPWYVGVKHQQLLKSYEAMLLWFRADRRQAADVLLGLKAEGYVTRALLTNLGSWLLELKDLEAAESVCREGIEYDPEDAGLLDNWGWCLWLTGKEEESRRLYQESVLPGQPVFPDAWLHWARIQRASGDAEASRESYQRALSCPFHGLSLYTRDKIEAELRELGG